MTLNTRRAAATPVVWVLLGVVITLVCVVIAGLVLWPRDGASGAQPLASRSAQGSESVRKTGGKPVRAWDAVRLTARSLVEPGHVTPRMSEAQAMTHLMARRDQARALAARGGAAGAVAGEYADAFENLITTAYEAPSAIPAVGLTLDALASNARGEEGAGLAWLMGIGAEASRHAEHSDRMKLQHTRIVSARLQAAAMALAEKRKPAARSLATAEFHESGLGSHVSEDTLILTNTSGGTLNEVIVIVEMTGRGGERFSNVFAADEWLSGRFMLATCPSGPPVRETVRDVRRIDVQVLAAGQRGERFSLTK